MRPIKTLDLLTQFRRSAQTYQPQGISRILGDAAREATGTPDVFTDAAGASHRLQRDQRARVAEGLGPLTLNWGADALPDLIALTDAGAPFAIDISRRLRSEPLSRELLDRVVTALVNTHDLNRVRSGFDALIENPSLDAPSRRAVVDWLVRYATRHDVTDPVTGIIRPNFAKPPSIDSLVRRAESSDQSAVRALAPLTAADGDVDPVVVERTMLVAMSDPSPSVRRLAAPFLWKVRAPDDRQLGLLLASFTSRAARSELRAHAEREFGPLSPIVDDEPDVIAGVGDFWPQRVENAAEFKAEFLGTLLNTAPKEALPKLIPQAVNVAKGNPGLVLDIMDAMKRVDAPIRDRAALLEQIGDGPDSVARALAIGLVAQDETVADVMPRSLGFDTELLTAPPVARLELLKKTARGVTGLLDAGRISPGDALSHLKAAVATANPDETVRLMASLVAHGISPDAILPVLVAGLRIDSGRPTYRAAIALLNGSTLPGEQLDAMVGTLLGHPALRQWSVNSNNSGGVPMPPMIDDAADGAFPFGGIVDDALISFWLSTHPDAARSEAMVQSALPKGEAKEERDARQRLIWKFISAGVHGSTIDAERARLEEKVSTDPLEHTRSLGAVLEPLRGPPVLGDLEGDFVAAAREYFTHYTLAKPTQVDADLAIANASTKPARERNPALLRALRATTPALATANADYSPEALVWQARLLPAADALKVQEAMVQFELQLAAEPGNRANPDRMWRALFSHSELPTCLDAAAVVRLAAKLQPAQRTILAQWLASPSAESVRSEVIAKEPDLGSVKPWTQDDWIGPRNLKSIFFDPKTYQALETAGTGTGPELERQQTILWGLAEDPLPAIRALISWNGPSLAWAQDALAEVINHGGKQHGEYNQWVVRELGRLLRDPRIDPRFAFDVAMRSASSMQTLWVGDSPPEPVLLTIAKACLQRSDLTPQQRSAIISAAVSHALGLGLLSALTVAEQDAVRGHYLSKIQRAAPGDPLDFFKTPDGYEPYSR